jgi:hypothetical protein
VATTSLSEILVLSLATSHPVLKICIILLSNLDTSLRNGVTKSSASDEYGC